MLIMLIVYIAVVFISLFLFGMVKRNEKPDDLAEITIWIAILIWPLTVSLAILIGIFYFPFWLGDKIGAYIVRREYANKPRPVFDCGGPLNQSCEDCHVVDRDAPTVEFATYNSDVE